jgi:hypothetical protein
METEQASVAIVFISIQEAFGLILRPDSGFVVFLSP